MYILKLVKDIEEFDSYFIIKSDEKAILWSGFKEKPDYIRMKEVFKEIITDKNQYLYYLIDNDTKEVVGYNQMKIVDGETIENRGHSILVNYQGLGLGTLIIQLVMNECMRMGFKYFGGFISENNIASINNVRKNGWVKTDIFELRELKAFNRVDKFYFYKVNLLNRNN